MNNFLYNVSQFPRRIVISLIKLYQKTFSFDHGPLHHFYPHGFCRFYPTCSQYGIEAIEKYGIVKGCIITIWRVLRCNPWNKGGNDPLK